MIFSTYVEMNRRIDRVEFALIHFLYVCGDEPSRWLKRANSPTFSLRMWRWTVSPTSFHTGVKIFSTYVEMNRESTSASKLCRHFLYVCGDEPLAQVKRFLCRAFSLRMWRWTDDTRILAVAITIFSTYVEMNRLRRARAKRQKNFLYVCGDEPLVDTHCRLPIAFSLRMWRWTECHRVAMAFADIFSTYVEMNRLAEMQENWPDDFLYFSLLSSL